MAALGIRGELEDMTMTLSDQVHVIKLVSDTSFLYLAASREGTNLAIVRNTIKNHADELGALGAWSGVDGGVRPTRRDETGPRGCGSPQRA